MAVTRATADTRLVPGQIVLFFANAISNFGRERFVADDLVEAREFAAGHWPFNNTRKYAARVLANAEIEYIDLATGEPTDR